MRLASYLAGGKPAFGIVTDMGVITLSDRLRGGSRTLKDALTEDDALDEMIFERPGAILAHRPADDRLARPVHRVRIAADQIMPRGQRLALGAGERVRSFDVSPRP